MSSSLDIPNDNEVESFSNNEESEVFDQRKENNSNYINPQLLMKR
jgi:hypothetical protein